MSPQLNIIERAHSGDLHGLNFAGLVRLSFEVDPDRELPTIPLSGLDINNRDEQEKKIRSYIEARGGNYLGTYHEPNTSAWKRRRILLPDGKVVYRVVRPIYQDALEDLKRGTPASPHFKMLDSIPQHAPLDGMAVIEIDRLTRDNIDLEDAINVVTHYSRPIIDVTGTLDLLTDNGRSMARVLVAMKGQQSADTARRLRDSHYSRALLGIPVGGNRPFGWQDDKRTLDQREAKAIRQAATDLLDGIGPYEICRRWNEAGLLTPKGKLWRRRSFILMITSPRMVGWRVYGPTKTPHHERYICAVDGTPVKGQYDAILDEEIWRKVVELLTGPGRPTGHAYTGMRRYLLSGVIRCGSCGRKLTCGAQPNDRFVYACKPPHVDGGCGKVCGSGIPIDRIVTQLVHAYFAEHRIAPEASPWPGTADLDAMNELKADLLSQFRDNPDMGKYIWPEIREAEAKIARLNGERTAHARGLAKPKLASVAAEWDTLDIGQQRAIVEEIFEAVILNPAARQSNRFDASRLSVVWREG